MDPEWLLRKLEERWRVYQEKLSRLSDVFRRTVRLLAQIAADAAQAAVDFWNTKIVPMLEKLNMWWADHANAFGAPWALFSAASRWRDDVGAPASARAGLATAGQVTVDDNWDGRSADAYREQLSQQEAAIKGLQSQFAEVIASALTKVGAGIIVWWASIIVAIGVVVLAALTATGEAISIVGLPAMPPTLLVALGAFLASLAGGVITLTALSVNATSDLEGASHNMAAYPGGKWPAFG